MNKLVQTAALVAAISAIPTIAQAHGGQYRGPGDVVPPGGGRLGGSNGGNLGGPAGPTATSGPGGPVSPVRSGCGPGGHRRNTGGVDDLAPDQTLWSFWWGFNKEPFLRLKSHIHNGSPLTGSDGYFLGAGAQRQGNDTLAPTEQQIRDTIVPALLATLETETNNDIVTGSLIALAKIGDVKGEDGSSAFEAVIAGWLSNPVQEISETAAVALGILANDASVSTLVSLLRDDEAGRTLVSRNEVPYRTRAFSAYGLALIGAKSGDEDVRREIVQQLTSVLESEDTSSRDLAVSCVVAMGLVPLETVTAEDGETVPASSLTAQIDYLLEYFENDKNRFLVRAHCPTALARLTVALPDEFREQAKERVATAFLERVKKHARAKAEVAQSCYQALGLLGDADSDPIDVRIRAALIEAPKNVEDLQARYFAAIAIAKVGGRPGKEGADAEGIREASRYLLRQLSEGRSGMEPWAGLAIGVMGRSLADADVTNAVTVSLSEALRETLRTERSDLRVGAYAIGAGVLGNREASSILSKKLARTSDDLTRGYVAVALGLLNEDTAKEDLREILGESRYRPDLLREVAIALALLEDNGVVPDLIDMLSEAKSLAVQAALSSALGFIGDHRSVDPLVEMLNDESITDTARGFAAVALGIVADKDELPWNTPIALDLNYRATTSTLNDPSGTAILNIL